MDIKEALKKLIKNEDIEFEQMRKVTLDIMSGKATDAQIGAFLVALHIKGETSDEIAAAAESMRRVSSKVPIKNRTILDTCGTGGDGSNSFNISTASAFVAASAGICVAKHGNRAASGSTGSADLLEAGGARIDLNPEQVRSCLEKLGIGFMFAPSHHKATKHVFNPRREIGIRTIFNFLGPLTNPANATSQLVGVFDASWVKRIAYVLRKLGTKRGLVVCSHNGMDEIAIDAPTTVAELLNGEIRLFEICPENFGINRQTHNSLIAKSPEESLRIVNSVFKGSDGPAFDIVSLNAGAAIYVGGASDTLENGVQKAFEILKSGIVMKKFEDFCSYTKVFSQEKGE